MEPAFGEPATPDAAARTIALFVEPCCGLLGTGSPGVISALVGNWRQHLHPLSRLGEGGRLAASVRGRLGRIPTWNMPWSTPPSSKSTATGRVQRGTQSQAIGAPKAAWGPPKPWRSRMRSATSWRPPCSCQGSASTQWRAAAHRRARLWGADRRYRFRQQCRRFCQHRLRVYDPHHSPCSSTRSRIDDSSCSIWSTVAAFSVETGVPSRDRNEILHLGSYHNKL